MRTGSKFIKAAECVSIQWLLLLFFIFRVLIQNIKHFANPVFQSRHSLIKHQLMLPPLNGTLPKTIFIIKIILIKPADEFIENVNLLNVLTLDFFRLVNLYSVN